MTVSLPLEERPRLPWLASKLISWGEISACSHRRCHTFRHPPIRCCRRMTTPQMAACVQWRRRVQRCRRMKGSVSEYCRSLPSFFFVFKARRILQLRRCTEASALWKKIKYRTFLQGILQFEILFTISYIRKMVVLMSKMV